MKIGLALKRPSLCAINSRHILAYEYRRVDSYQEAMALIQHEGFEDYGVSPLLFQKLALLERNKEFQNAIYDVRERFNVPNDLKYPKDKNYTLNRNSKWLLAFGAECMEFDLKYKMPFWLRNGNVSQILYTSTLEYFHPNLAPIGFGIPTKDTKSLCLSVYSRNVSIEQIHEFIEQNRNKINRELKRLPLFSPTRTKEFDRDIRIFDILQENPGISWGKVTDIIASEFPQDKNCSESAIRMAAHRIKKSIDSIFTKRIPPLKPILQLFLDENWDEV